MKPLSTLTLEYGIPYDLHMKSGHVHKGWYLYSAECGYFSKTEGRQNDGFVYAEDVAHVVDARPTAASSDD